jgi:ribonuclease HI
MTAISWVRKKRCNSSYVPKNQKLMDIIKKAEKWLTVNNYSTPLLKWNTENW